MKIKSKTFLRTLERSEESPAWRRYEILRYAQDDKTVSSWGYGTACLGLPVKGLIFSGI